MSKARYAHSRSRGNKPMAAVLAAVLIVAALIGGVFAWTDFTQSQTNKFRGTFDADVTLHDEFDGVNKDVFVENSGTNTIHARVRLDEFMQIGQSRIFQMNNAGAGRPVADKRNKATWIPHTYGASDINNCGRTDAGADKFHGYYQWDITGAQRPYTPGIPGMVYTQLDANENVDDYTAYNGTTRQETAGAMAPILMSDFKRVNDQVASWETSNGAKITQSEAESLLSSADIVTYNAYTAGCWILDDTDTDANGGSWAYWSKPLKGYTYNADGTVQTYGEATNVLLDEVRLLNDADDDWIYRIDVKLQAVTLGDTEKWNQSDSSAPYGYKLTGTARELISLWKAA